MKLYITNHNYEKIKQSFLNLRLYYFIDVKEIIKNLGYDKQELDEFNTFIVNQTIENKIQSATSSKRFKSIVYINENLNDDIISSIQEYITDIPKIENLVFIDDANNKENTAFHSFFKELLYFPTGKKVRIIECKPIKSKMFYWVNDIELPSDLIDDE